jgi:hypothetical protein
MSPEGTVKGVYPEGTSSLYIYVCEKDDKMLFTVPVEHRYHKDILESEGNPVGRRISYIDDVDPPVIEFLE